MSQLLGRVRYSAGRKLRWHCDSKPNGVSEMFLAGTRREEQRGQRVLGVQPALFGWWLKAHQLNYVHDWRSDDGEGYLAENEG